MMETDLAQIPVIDVRSLVSGAEERFEVAEVLEDRAQRHTRLIGDANGRRSEVTVVDQAQQRIDDGEPGTVRASSTAVDREIVRR